jgi:hypothetical protein
MLHPAGDGIQGELGPRVRQQLRALAGAPVPARRRPPPLEGRR